MADPQKVSAHLIYFCDLPDLANRRFLFSAKWSRHKFFFFLIFFYPNLLKVHSNAEKINHNNKEKRSEFFFFLRFWLREMREIVEFSIVFFIGIFFWVSSGARGRGPKFKSLCIFGSEKLMCGSIVRIKFMDQLYE